MEKSKVNEHQEQMAKTQFKNFYIEGIQKLVFLWLKCILKNGDCIKKWSKSFFFPECEVGHFIEKFTLFIEWDLVYIDVQYWTKKNKKQKQTVKKLNHFLLLPQIPIKLRHRGSYYFPWVLLSKFPSSSLLWRRIKIKRSPDEQPFKSVWELVHLNIVITKQGVYFSHLWRRGGLAIDPS